MNPPPELIQLVLGEFQAALRENMDSNWDAKHGKPPRYGYVEHKESLKGRKAHETWNNPVAAAWHISRDTLKSTTIKEWGQPMIDGMFYDLFRGWFVISTDGASVQINWQTGPRFGRGYAHRIGVDTHGKYLLGKGERTWMS